MIAICRRALLATACLLVIGAAGTLAAHAEDTAKQMDNSSPQVVAPAQQPDQAAEPAGMAACPGMPGGGCCGQCQGKMALGDEGGDADGGCPCQRARKLQQQEQGS